MTTPATELELWATFIAHHRALPIHAVLGWPRSDLETEIIHTIARLAKDHARELVRTNKPAPKGGDGYSRAVQRMVLGATAAKRAREQVKQHALEERLFREQEAKRQQV